MDSKLKLFLDANIFIAGSASLTGGSAIILMACQKGLLQAVASEIVLEEAERNIKNKFKNRPDVLERFIFFINHLNLKLSPTVSDLEYYKTIITPKDAQVLADAINSQSDYLITLDREHFFTPIIKQSELPIQIITPKDFIQKVLIKTAC